MSFSFSTAGTADQVIVSLSKAQTNDNNVGNTTRDFAIAMVQRDTTKPDETHEVRYVVTASGHSSDVVGSSSHANLSFSVAFVPKSVPSA